MSINLRHEGVLYNFSRDQYGVGNWCCISGRPPGMFGGVYSGIILHTSLQQKLSAIAVEKGVATREQLSSTLNVEKKSVTTKSVTASKRKRGAVKRPRLVRGFNPFSSGREVVVKLSSPSEESGAHVSECTSVSDDTSSEESVSLGVEGYIDSFFEVVPEGDVDFSDENTAAES